MSDIRYMHQLLEPHSLDYIAVQWDGSDDAAVTIIRELQLELRMRDAAVVRAKHHKVRSSTSINDANRIELMLERKSDGETRTVDIEVFGWLVINLHEGRLYSVVTVPGPVGDAMFRRVRPVVRLQIGEPLSLPDPA